MVGRLAVIWFPVSGVLDGLDAIQPCRFPAVSHLDCFLSPAIRQRGGIEESVSQAVEGISNVTLPFRYWGGKSGKGTGVSQLFLKVCQASTVWSFLLGCVGWILVGFFGGVGVWFWG